MRLARASLVVFALVLPFEVPLFPLGPLRITSVELALYVMLGVSALAFVEEEILDASAPRPGAGPGASAGVVRLLRSAVLMIRTDTMARAIVLWAGVVFVSALAAPAYRAAAMKFALRSSSGIFAFFATRHLARDERTRKLVLSALLAGALLSALTAVIEEIAPASASFWGRFRESSFDAFGLQRASGVFAYPTIGAMYWEAAMPLLVVAPFLGCLSRGRAAKTNAAVVIGSGLLVAALLASATRSGLAGTAAVCGVLIALGPRLGPRIRRTAAQALAVLAALSAVALGPSDSRSLLGQRLRWWDDDRWFRVEYVGAELPPKVYTGEPAQITVGLRNTGALGWPSSGTKPVRLAYHWEPLDRPQTNTDYEGYRNALPYDVPPGGQTQIVATVWCPPAAGTYVLRLDLVQEDVTWFSEHGNRMPEANVVVEGASKVITESPRIPPQPPPPPRLALWKAATVLWQEHPILGVGPDNFRRSYEAVLSPAPNGQPYTDTRLHANSLYFETLADLGLFGVFALGAMAVALWRAVREGVAAGHADRVGCGIAAVAFFFHGVLDYFLEFTPLFGLFWVLLGLTVASEKTSPTPAHASKPT
jgi:hypothetical protein